MKILLYISLSLIVLITVFFLYFSILLGSKPVDQDVLFEIKKGQSTSEIIKNLNEIGYLNPNTLFYYYVGFVKIKDKSYLQAGYYNFKKGMSNDEIITSLTSGKNLYTIKVTIAEGFNIYDIASSLKKNLNSDSTKFIELAFDQNLLSKYGIKSNSIEGYMYPNTYFFQPNTKLEKIIDILISTQQSNWKSDFDIQMQTIGFDKHKVLTMASIIEAETPNSNERARVSGLYQNRLRIGMLLQSDPTVQYAIGERKKLTYTDLKFDNRYNTYKYKGLPPGPINNPSLSSIIAALYPEENNYLYMVASGENNGTHNFATNYQEHLKFVKQYRQSRSNQ